MPRCTARMLFLAIQAGYVAMYCTALYKMESLEEVLARVLLLPAGRAVTVIVVSAMSASPSVSIHDFRRIGWIPPRAKSFDSYFPGCLSWTLFGPLHRAARPEDRLRAHPGFGGSTRIPALRPTHLDAKSMPQPESVRSRPSAKPQSAALPRRFPQKVTGSDESQLAQASVIYAGSRAERRRCDEPRTATMESVSNDLFAYARPLRLTLSFG